MTQEYRKGAFEISTDPARLDLKVIHHFLTHSYWATGITPETVKKSVENALCFGMYESSKQIGFARVITDFARIAHLADVFIIEPYRGRGLATWLMQCIMSHPELRGLRWVLRTKDAHGLYRKFGFEALQEPETYMEAVNPGEGNKGNRGIGK